MSTETGRPEDFRESLRTLLACDSRDWGRDRADAWIYGIVFGWDAGPEDLPQDPEDPEEDAMSELARRHSWPADEVARLRGLHAQFEAATPTPDTEGLAALSDAATPGPWEYETAPDGFPAMVTAGGVTVVADTYDKPHLSDAAFIAGAANYVRALLADIEGEGDL